MSSLSENTVITTTETFNPENVIVQKIEEKDVAGKGGAMKYKSANIAYTNEENKTGHLVLMTPKVYSFGLSDNKMGEGEHKGHSLPLCLFSKDGATEEESAWVEMFENTLKEAIIVKVKASAVENGTKIAKLDDKLSQMSFLWRKEEGSSPVMYAKLFESKKTGAVFTRFTDSSTGEIIKWEDMMGKPCDVVCALKVESVYFGSTFKVQCKLQEVQVSFRENNRKTLLPPAKSLGFTKENPIKKEEEDEEEEAPKPLLPPAPKPVKVVQKKVVKKVVASE